MRGLVVLALCLSTAIGADLSLTSWMKKMGDSIKEHVEDFKVEGKRDFSRLGELMGGGGWGNPFLPSFARMDDLLEDTEASPEEDLSEAVDPFASSGLSLPGLGGPGLLGTIDRLMGTLDQFNPLNIFDGWFGSWWEGEHVCVETEETEEGVASYRDFHFTFKINGMDLMDDGDMSSSSSSYVHEEHCYETKAGTRECKVLKTENGVVKTTVTRYACCHGYRRDFSDGQCRQMLTKTVEETARATQDGTEFLAMLNEENSMSLLNGNVTLLLPMDKAVEQYEDFIAQQNGLGHQDLVYNTIIERVRRELTVAEGPDMRQVLRAHFLPGFVRSDQFEDGELKETMAPGGKLLITVYNSPESRVVMANCAKLTAPDNMATNGIVHLVDKMIVPANKSVADILSSDTQFRALTEMLKKSGIWRDIEKKGQFTIFAPSDAAVEKLSADLKTKLLSGDLCSQDILRHHILPHVLCSSIVTGKTKTRSSLGKYVAMERDAEGHLMVEGKKVLIRDIVATNGVIHVVEDVLLPDYVQPGLLDSVRRKSKFMADLLEKSDVLTEVDHLSNLTLLLPTETAVGQLPTNFTTELLTNKEKMREFLSYHIVSQRKYQPEIANNLMLDSLLPGKQVRLNSYQSLLGSPRVTAQCAKLEKEGMAETCGGVIHTVDKVLLPPHGSLLTLLKASPEYSSFLELVTLADLEEELENEARTVIAPTNDVFEKLEPTVWDGLKQNTNKTTEIVKKHILKSVLCCAGIQNQNVILQNDRMKTLGETVSIRRTASGNLLAEGGAIVKCDMMATNGVLHSTDTIFIEKARTTYTTPFLRLFGLSPKIF